MKSKYTTLYLIMLFNIVFFALESIFSRSFQVNHNVLIAMGASNGELIRSGEWYRTITSEFLHINVLHLLVNMYALSILGQSVIDVLGTGKFLIIYFLSAIVSGSTTLLNQNTSAGASGAIFGLMGAMLVFATANRRVINKQYLFQLIGIVGINLFLSFVLSNLVDMYGHLGGLITGIVVTSIIMIGEKRKWVQK